MDLFTEIYFHYNEKRKSERKRIIILHW